MKLIIQKRTVNYSQALQSYSCDLEITVAEDITNKCFVVQRITSPALVSTDTFVAVATPVQLEDFPEDSPAPDSSYFRTSKIALVAASSSYLEEIINQIVTELGQLVDNMLKLNALSEVTTFTIEST